MTKKRLRILRGLPGAGKTRETLEASRAEEEYIICSADTFFCTEDGEYRFEPWRLGEAHAACQLLAFNAMSTGIPLVIIDNTNTRHWEFQLYQRMGEYFGYDVEVRTVGGRSYEDVRKYAKRNVHEVPELKILEMAYRWED